MPIPGAEQQYAEIFKFSPITSKLYSPDYAAFCSRLKAEGVDSPEPFLFFVIFGSNLRYLSILKKKRYA